MYTDRLSKLTKARENLATYQEQYDELIAKEEYYRNEISKLENEDYIATVSYTHLTLPTTKRWCRSRWSPYH